METELWFNKVGNTGIPMANPDLVTASPTRDVITNNQIFGGNPQKAPTTDSIVCNKCNDGAPVSNMFDVKWRFDKQYVCPDGWTMDKDPCRRKLDSKPVLMDEEVNTAGLGDDSEIMKILPYVGIAVLGYFLLIK